MYVAQCHFATFRVARCLESLLLRSATEGKLTDVVAEVQCPSALNLRSVLVSRESLWRLCGYGASPADRYLDDQV